LPPPDVSRWKLGSEFGTDAANYRIFSAVYGSIGEAIGTMFHRLVCPGGASGRWSGGTPAYSRHPGVPRGFGWIFVQETSDVSALA